ncbi:MAG: histidine kinase [bacterium]
MKRIERPIWTGTLVAVAWAGNAVLLGAMFILERELRTAGKAELTDASVLGAAGWISAIAGAAVVGSVLAVRRPANPAGWLFLVFATSISLSGFTGAYGAYGLIYRPDSLPGAWFAAVYSDGAFLPWVSLLALILLITPTGSAPSSRWKGVGWAAGASAVIFVAVIPFRSSAIDSSPFAGLKGPYATGPFAPAASAVAFAMLVTAHVALLGAIASLLYRVRRSSPVERRQLRWLLVPAIPFPFLVVGAWAAAAANNDALLGVLGIGYLVIIPIAAALAIEKQRLYDVDRLVSRAVAYTLLSALIVLSYLAIVVAAGVIGGRAAAESVPAAIAATIIALAIGGFARRRLQDVIDRRFNRRAFTALGIIRSYVREPDEARSIEDVLREASGDAALRAVYWVESGAAWVAESGETAASPGPAAFLVPVREGGRGAAIEFDPAKCERELISALAATARPELENARLRAAIHLQLVEVRESRARIVSAQLEERKRIERDLHDGSQQRLLALALNLRATELSGDSEAALRALPGAVNELQATVRELRNLANGLHPSALEGGGLAAAFQELAARAPIPIRLSVTEERLPAPVESSAWFIACEALTNVVKHARATAVSLAAALEGGSLVLSIEDDGVGGADLHGHGLRGIADRAEAAGGRLIVSERPTGGTSVRAVLPCES